MSWRNWKIFLAMVIVIPFVALRAPSKEGESSPNSKATNGQQGDQRGKASTTTGKGNPAKGEDIFQANCAGCHNPDSYEVLVGPGLKGVLKSAHKHADGTNRTHTLEEIRKQIKKGSESMPAMEDYLSEGEIADVLAYLHTL